MDTKNMFEYAVRNKLRFPFKGMITTEDLFDLTVNQLDEIYKTLNKDVKTFKEESLLFKKQEVDEELTIKINILKYIVETKLAEKEAKDKAFAKAQQKQKIMSIIATKQDEKLANSSIDELQAMLNELDN